MVVSNTWSFLTIIIPLGRVLVSVPFFLYVSELDNGNRLFAARGVFRMYEYIVYTHHYISSYIWVSGKSLDFRVG